MPSKKIITFIPYNGNEQTFKTVAALKASNCIDKVYLLTGKSISDNKTGCEILETESLFSSGTLSLINKKASSDYILLLTNDSEITFGQYAIERFLNIAENTSAGILYSDYYEIKSGEKVNHPVIDYQTGSIRDDFNFGPMLFLNKSAVEHSINESTGNYKFAGLYDLRLSISRHNPVIRIPEFLYSTGETDIRKSGEKQFEYVNPKNRDVQIEMELAATEHLKKINAYLKPKFKEVTEEKNNFEFEASVIIPVKNRAKTIGDAIKSVLEQDTDFLFNLIVVDNYSTDGTAEIIKEFAFNDKKVIHVIPQRKDLGIGGCWNEGIHHKSCGKYSVQLDSDDIYSGNDTLQKIIDVFRNEKCAMVIGSYRLTDFQLNEIPPGLIDHREWTPDNGRNNALRINGLGAPRAFYTPILREIKVPNVSYGEDYALALAVSRNYKIGRIYESIYNCRRWEGNSDSALSIEKQNEYNTYKDRLRTFEIIARQKMNSSTLPFKTAE